MDGWWSGWTNDPIDFKSMPSDFDKSTASYNQEASTMDSPNVSKDSSIESTGEQVEKNDSNLTKPTFKSVLQAKKRLQAFSASKQLKKSCSKDEKSEDLDKSDKTSSKRSKKALYPLDKAQAVVQEIEEIKQKEAQEAQQEQKKIDAIMAVAYKTIALKETYRVGARSTSLEREQQFKKREIKCRNYRRSDSFKRRSASPENYNNKRLGKLVYPKNWTEYKQQGLTLVKDEELKSKIFPNMKYSAHELVTKFLTFDGPSPIIESFKCLTLEEKLDNIPMCFLRITRSKPTLTYSVNSRKNKDSFLTRKQLFHFIPRDRRAAIEKLINTASSRSQFQSRTLTSRPWYAKSWKRSADAECKILENSVGLSFLQTYSDEEEENETEEIVNSTSIKENETILETSKHNGREIELSFNRETVFDEKKKESEERETLTPEERPEAQKDDGFGDTKKCGKKEQSKPNEWEEKSEKTPEIIKKHSENTPEEAKKKDKDDLSETRRAIKDLEEELERRKAIREEEEKQTKRKKKKKVKKKKKKPTSESEEEEKHPKKKKKKVKIKKKKFPSESDDSSSDEKSKKSKKKNKQKTKKVVKKDVIKKTDKTKKKLEESEGEEQRKKVEVDFETNADEDKKNKKKSVEKSKERAYEEDFAEFELRAKTTNLEAEENTPKNIQVASEFEEETKPFRDGKFYSPPNNLEKEKDKNISIEFKRSSNKYEEDIKKSFEIDRSWKYFQKSKYDVFPSKSEDSTRKNDFLKNDMKVNEKLKDKHRHKEDKDQWTLERSDRYDFNEKRSNESLEMKRDDPNSGRHSDKSEKQKENTHKLKSPVIKNEPDWEYLRSKRNKHRHNDYKESLDSLANEFEGFPLEEELSKETDKDSRLSKDEIGTPDTEDYRANWEKDSYPIWESEDEAPTKVREKLNSSWESDEEVFERPRRVVENPRPLSDTFDLEIPLNIKPFKRREIIDPDAELQLLKKQSLSLSEERRMLEIEKQRVKELELKVIREMENKVEEDSSLKRKRSKDEQITEVEHKDSKKRDGSRKRDNMEKEETPKRGRWDRKLPSPKVLTLKQDIIDITQIKKEIVNDEDSLTNVSSTTSLNTSAVLENEYEEFMKALTSSSKKPQAKSKVLEAEICSESTTSVLSKNDKASVSAKARDNQNSVEIQVVNNTASENVPLPSVAPIVTILPKDIPLIPMPLPKAEIKPVPVPSPQVEIDKIPKPLINLSLSANITLDIAPKFTTPPICSPSTTVNTLQDKITHSPIVKSLEKASFENNEDLSNFASLADTGLDVVKEKTTTVEEEQKPTSKPFVFTSMVLPSKRQLLSNSKLNLDDSDDEQKHTKPLKKLEDIMKENKTETEIYKISLSEETVKPEAKQVEPAPEKTKEVDKEVKKPEKKEMSHPKTPQEKDSRRKRTPERHARRDASPKRSSHGSGSKREISPRRRSRESPPRRRAHSPKRYSPRRRSSPKRRSPAKRRHSPRRSISPKSRRRNSLSPRRKSPRRSHSPKFRAFSPKKVKSKSPERHLSSYKPSDRSLTDSNKPKSPTAMTSPLEGLKRSVADSTISDDLLLQPMNIEEYTQSPVTQFYDRSGKTMESPKRESLDVRINQALGLTKEEPQPIPTTYCNYNYTQFSQQFNKIVEPKNLAPVQTSFNNVCIQQQLHATQQMKSNFVQVGNMVQILPTEHIPMIEMENVSMSQQMNDFASSAPPTPRSVVKCEKSQIVQVGNMLQIVPADLPPESALLAEPKIEPEIQMPAPIVAVLPEKQSAESAMRLKVAERREEREKRRLEREKRRKEKERRRREKEKQRQIKLKQRTENMIKKALELEAEGLEEEPEPIQSEPPAQWPPLPAFVSSTPSKEVGKSILVRASVKNDSLRLEGRKKVVQFADGVKPGEGTSPSGGEELSSPPPRKKLPKERRYKKTKLHKKNQKKKVKVRIIKKRPETDSDEEDNLPPPSPPPGSPPPHIFPPRMKPQPINNIQPYLPNVVPIQANHGQQQLFQSPQLSLIMHPRHPHHGPPPPPHHHGPPPPPHHHHHPHGPPLPPPPGPPHFHHGPPPPPPHHHGPPPPPGPPHHHHCPPPPFHR